MSDPTKKTCGQCGAARPATNEFFGTDKQQPDSLRRICKECYSDNRYGDRTKAVQRLRVHDKLVAKAECELKDNLAKLSPGQVEKYERIVRLAPEHRAELQTKIQEAHKAEEAARIAQAASPSLARVQTIGSALFGSNGELLSVADRPAQLEKFKAALATLTGTADAAARDYVESNIARLQDMVETDSERESEKAVYDQEVIDGQACQAAADAIHDKFTGLFSAGVSRQTRDALTMQFRLYRAEAQQQNMNIKPCDRTATGASCKKIAQRILEELTAIASRLGKAGTEVGAHQSLENAQSLDWQQAASARDMRAYVRQLTEKLEAARKTMTPEAYKKKFLELPVAPKEQTVIWRARLLNGVEEWFWSSGNVVKRGVDVGTAEVVKDAIHGWVLTPSPVGAELDDENKPVGKLEWVQEDNSRWVKKIVDPEERWEQHDDATWHKVAGSDSPWSKPEPIVFKVAPPQPDAEHCEFRSGHWWTKAECDAVEQGPTLDKPPVILPPLARTKADSIAVEPPPNAIQLERMNRPAQTVWERHEQKEKFRKEQEAAMLRGVFLWDKNQALPGDSHGNR